MRQPSLFPRRRWTLRPERLARIHAVLAQVRQERELQDASRRPRKVTVQSEQQPMFEEIGSARC